MPLHLVGETLSARQAHLRAERGELLQLIRGVYVEAAEDADTVLLGQGTTCAPSWA